MNSDEKLDAVLAQVNTMLPVVQRMEKDLATLNRSMGDTNIKDAQQDLLISQAQGDLDRLGDKLRAHISDHWKFITIICAIVGTGVALLRVSR